MSVNIEKILKEKSKEVDAIIEKYIPRKYTKEFLDFTFGRPKYRYNIDAVNKTISDPVWDFLDRGGKRWRPVLFLLVTEALGGNVKKVSDFVIIPELIHNGTIIVDDLEDNSEERRGKPALHRIFGNDIAINAGNLLYYLPLLPIVKNNNRFSSETLLKVYNTYVQEMMNLSLGQATDIAWHKGMANADNISEEEYFQMCANKTGCIARLSVEIAAILAQADENTVERLGKFAESIGVAFQIQDDILNLVGEEFTKKGWKGGAGEDITEGKRTLLVIHTLKKANDRDKKRLLEILNMHTTDQKMRNETIEIIKKYGSIEYAKEKAKAMVKEAWDGIEKILPESDAKEKLKAFAYYLIERKI